MRHRPQNRNRRGATLVEAAIVLLAFLTLILGMLDLSIGVFQYHIVSQAARQGVRLAIVHGSMAPAAMGIWPPQDSNLVVGSPGPPAATYGPVAGNDSDAIAQAIQPYLTGLDASQARITVVWLDLAPAPEVYNQPEKRVRVKVTYPYRPMMTFIFGHPTITLSATSTMIIAH